MKRTVFGLLGLITFMVACSSSASSDPVDSNGQNNLTDATDPFTIDSSKPLMTRDDLLGFFAPGTTDQANVGGVHVNVRQRSCTTQTQCGPFSPSTASLIEQPRWSGSADTGIDLFGPVADGTVSLHAPTTGVPEIDVSFSFAATSGRFNEAPFTLEVNCQFYLAAGEDTAATPEAWPPRGLDSRCSVMAKHPDNQPDGVSNFFVPTPGSPDDGLNGIVPTGAVGWTARIDKDGSFQVVSLVSIVPEPDAANNLTQIALSGKIQRASP
jgi:hypothetical protein